MTADYDYIAYANPNPCMIKNGKKSKMSIQMKSLHNTLTAELLLDLEEACPSKPQGFISLSLLLRRPWRGGLHPPPPPPPLTAALTQVSGGGEKDQCQKTCRICCQEINAVFLAELCVLGWTETCVRARSWTRLISKQAAASLLFGPPLIRPRLWPAVTPPYGRARSALDLWTLHQHLCAFAAKDGIVCVFVCVLLDRVCQWTRVGWWVDMIGFQLNLVKNKCNRYR